MATGRLEPFRQALIELRGRLRDGRLEPGARITAKEVADGLKLSPTPVREALSRLAGEGLIEERRGDGFFVPELSAADVAALYGLSEQLLQLAQGPASPQPRDPRPLPADDDPVAAVERLFMAWAGQSESRVTSETYRTLMLRLAPVRRREAHLIDDLAQEAAGLLRLADPAHRPDRPDAIARFHRRRIELAEPLARLLETPSAELS